MDQALRPFNELAGESFCQMKFRVHHTWLNWHHLLPSESSNGTQPTDVVQCICAAQVIQTGNLERRSVRICIWALWILVLDPPRIRFSRFTFLSFLHILYSLVWVFSCLYFNCIQLSNTPGHWLIFSVFIWSRILWRKFYKTSCRDLLDLFSTFQSSQRLFLSLYLKKEPIGY